MRREFPLWSSVGASCPGITVNSTGAAIAAGTQIGAVPSNAIDWAVEAEQTLALETNLVPTAELSLLETSSG